MTPCHQTEPFRDDWASLLTAEERQLIETGAIVVSSGPLIGADPHFVRNIVSLSRRFDDDPEYKQLHAEAEARGKEACTRCICKDCRARLKGSCEKKCMGCDGIRELSRCDFKEEYQAGRKP